MNQLVAGAVIVGLLLGGIAGYKLDSVMNSGDMVDCSELRKTISIQWDGKVQETPIGTDISMDNPDSEGLEFLVIDVPDLSVEGTTTTFDSEEIIDVSCEMGASR